MSKIDLGRAARWGAGIVLALVILGYGIFESRGLIGGPRLFLEQPENGEILTNDQLTIAGRVKNVIFISLNDRPITIDETGRFQERLLLAGGYNIIKLSVRDRFGRERTSFLELWRKQNDG